MQIQDQWYVHCTMYMLLNADTRRYVQCTMYMLLNADTRSSLQKISSRMMSLCTVQVYIAMLLNKYKIRDVYVYCTCFKIHVKFTFTIYIVLRSASYISIQKDDILFQFWFLPNLETVESLKHFTKAKIAINSFSLFT